MPLPELYPELWSLVFRFLKRDVPPPWALDVTWSDLHQEELATLCRVSVVRTNQLVNLGSDDRLPVK